MREVISLHLGQAGIGIGECMWDLFNTEHDVGMDGMHPSSTFDLTAQPNQDDAYLTFYSENKAGTLRPRALMVDLDRENADNVRVGNFRQLFHPEQIVSGKEGAAGNWARGHCTIGKEIIDVVLERIRKQADQCTGLQGFMIYHGVGGGTGGGLCSLLLERLSVDYGKKAKISTSIYPSAETSEYTMEPYSTILTTHSLLEHTDVTFTMENSALASICKSKLDITTPTFTNMNRLVAMALSGITANIRFNGQMNTDFRDFQTNLVPYPRIHFVMNALAPLMSPKDGYNENPSIDTITNSLLDSSNQLVSLDPLKGKFMAITVSYRGDANILSANNIKAAISFLKRREGFEMVSWCPNGIKTARTDMTSGLPFGWDIYHSPQSASILYNNTKSAEIFSRNDHKFDLMQSGAEYARLLLEGMEEGEWGEMRENIRYVMEDYKEIENSE